MAAVGLDRPPTHDRCKRNQPFCGPPSEVESRGRSSPKRDADGANRAPAGCNPLRGADPTAGTARLPGAGAPPGGRDHRWVGRGRLAAEGTTVTPRRIHRAAERDMNVGRLRTLRGLKRAPGSCPVSARSREAMAASRGCPASFCATRARCRSTPIRLERRWRSGCKTGVAGPASPRDELTRSRRASLLQCR
jgi:hypothetical protein